MNTLRNWLTRKSLKRKKQRLLVEILADIDFIEQFRGEYLNFDDAKARQQLTIEGKKENKDQALIDRLAEGIANANTIKAEYQRLKLTARELPDYIALL